MEINTKKTFSSAKSDENIKKTNKVVKVVINVPISPANLESENRVLIAND